MFWVRVSLVDLVVGFGEYQFGRVCAGMGPALFAGVAGCCDGGVLVAVDDAFVIVRYSRSGGKVGRRNIVRLFG